MSEAVAIFGKSVQEAQVWVNEVTNRLSTNNTTHAYHVLKATLHALRDRIGPENAIHLSAQLPLLIRGLFFEGWRPTKTPSHERQIPDFLLRVGAEIGETHLTSLEAAVRAVFEVLWNHLDQGETAKLIHMFPSELKPLWQAQRR